MKSNELRIGNLFNNNGNIDTVTPNEIEALFESESREWIKPIPLTEEWLLKFGFVKPAHSWCGDIFHLSEWDDYPLNWCVAFNKNNAIIVQKLKHVHQLQNLMFALTGEELTIKE